MLARIRDIFQNSLPITVDSVVELLALAGQRRKHHGARSVDIVSIVYILQVAFRPIGFFYDGDLQGFGKVVQRVAHIAHVLRLLIPLPHLLRIAEHLVSEVGHDVIVHLGGVGSGAVQALLHHGKALKHLCRHIERQHSQEDDVHQVDHLLARGDRSFFDCHYSLTLLIIVLTCIPNMSFNHCHSWVPWVRPPAC